MIGSSVYDFTRPADHDRYTSAPLLSWDWFSCPIEFNTAAKLTSVNQDLTVIAVASGCDDVWIGGGQATLLSDQQWADVESDSRTDKLSFDK